MDTISNIAAYKFAPMTNLGPLRTRWLALCRQWHLRGTILLSAEGINLFIAGAPDKVDLLLAELRALPELADLQVKRSESGEQPFNRMLVRVKKEIIAFGVEGIEPGRHTSPKLPPAKLKQWLDEGKPVLLLDTRNDYEVKLGTFQNARAIGIDHFREFPEAVRQLPPEMKEQPVVIFCTGGIRCEKAGPFMEREGFQIVFQLEGGILKYFEDCGSAHYRGECFVFDQRVGVDPSLRETDSTQCFACLEPLTAAEQADPRYVPGKSCPHCHQTPEQQRRATLDRRHEAIRRVTTPLPGSVPYEILLPVNVPQECDGWRLIETLCEMVRHVPRAEWEQEFASGLVLDPARQAVTPTTLVRGGQRYFHRFPAITDPDVNADIRILHEDEALIVIHKPAPLPMHAGGRYNRNTLQYILNAAYYPEKPRQAHRLDANTTGVSVLTRSQRFAALVQPQFARGEVEKVYLVRVHGSPLEDAFDCTAPISSEPGEGGSRAVDHDAGLHAHTKFRVLRRDTDGTSLLEARPLTGRTNQIRIHCWHLGWPVCGDLIYQSNRQKGAGQTASITDAPLCLHSWRIAFAHPISKQRVEFEAPAPTWAGDAMAR